MQLRAARREQTPSLACCITTPRLHTGVSGSQAARQPHPSQPPPIRKPFSHTEMESDRGILHGWIRYSMLSPGVEK